VQNVPYAIVRLDEVRGPVVGYMLVCPYYAALHALRETVVELPVSHAQWRLWDELERLSVDDSPRRLDRRDAEEIVLLAEEFAGWAEPILLSVEPVGLAAPTFAAKRLQRKLAQWVDAERAGVPLCPCQCRACGDRLERTGTFAAAHPEGDRKFHYSCREHQSQEADFSRASRRWLDLRS
jgi:hypothetical protein